jgi:hypothetical protein
VYYDGKGQRAAGVTRVEIVIDQCRDKKRRDQNEQRSNHRQPHSFKGNNYFPGHIIHGHMHGFVWIIDIFLIKGGAREPGSKHSNSTLVFRRY